MPNDTSNARRETLNLRIRQAERELIERAAELTGKTKTDFVLDAARHAAERAILEHSLSIVGAAAFDEFRARLDAPPQPNDQLRRALQLPEPKG